MAAKLKSIPRPTCNWNRRVRLHQFGAYRVATAKRCRSKAETFISKRLDRGRRRCFFCRISPVGYRRRRLTPVALGGGTLDYSQYVDGIGVYAFNAASGRIVGDIRRDHAISIRGTTPRMNMTLTPGATNFGVISLGSTPTAGGVSTTQNLINRGRIVSLPGVQGNGIGTLTNHGHVDVQATLGVSQLFNHGTITVASNVVLSLFSLESIQAAGELVVEGNLVSGGRLRFDGGTMEVTGSASVRTLEVNAPGLAGTFFVEDVQYGRGAGGTATFRLLGGSAFRGTVPAGHTLLLEPDPGSPPSSINVLGTNVNNGGRIQMPAGTLSHSGMIPFINGPTGSLIVGGGQLPVLQNEGLIEINGAANLLNVTNLGTFVVAGTGTATMSNNGVFTHTRGKMESRGLLRGFNLALEVNAADFNGNFDLGGGRLTYGAGAGGTAWITSIGALSGTVPDGHFDPLGIHADAYGLIDRRCDQPWDYPCRRSGSAAHRKVDVQCRRRPLGAPNRSREWNTSKRRRVVRDWYLDPRCTG